MTGMDLLDDDTLLDLRPRGRRTDPAAFIERERRRTTLPPENPALRDWQETAPLAPADPRAPREGTEVCALCGTRQARSTCAHCGRAVCTTDLWTMLGLCRQCAAAGSGARTLREPGAEGPDAPDGADRAG